MNSDEHENLPWCHIYAQYIWHGDAMIEGTRAALVEIRDAIDQALRTGMDAETKESIFTRDGEGYRVVVKVRNYAYLQDATLPYTAHFASGVGARAVEAAAEDDRNMKRAIRESRRKNAAGKRSAT